MFAKQTRWLPMPLPDGKGSINFVQGLTTMGKCVTVSHAILLL
jgi:hypothetical protein